MNEFREKFWVFPSKVQALRHCEDLKKEGRSFELHSPYPVKELRQKSMAPLWVFCGGTFGAVFLFVLVVLSTYDYVLNVAGQPSLHPPAFLLAYVGLIFFATISCFAVFLYEGGLLFYDSESAGEILYPPLLEGRFVVVLKEEKKT